MPFHPFFSRFTSKIAKPSPKLPTLLTILLYLQCCFKLNLFLFRSLNEYSKTSRSLLTLKLWGSGNNHYELFTYFDQDGDDDEGDDDDVDDF